MSAPALVLVAHGTRSARGVEMIAALAEAVGNELGVAVSGRDADAAAAREPLPLVPGPQQAAGPVLRTSFVDVLGPSPAEVLRDLTGTVGESVPAVVVPAFLASGYHVYQDVPREVADSGHGAVAITPAMGPDPALARIMTMRLRAAGWRPGDAVVFAVAGSSDPRARQDVRRAAAMLAERLDTPVRLGYIATGAPRVADVVAALRESGAERVFVASYLLAHGLFHERLHDAGADGVAEPIGVHPAVVRLIADRYRAAARELVRARVR
ncbi:sirohydrochlorin chelatase [Nocardia brasiliensis]|uniref:sirohydrochlorin chelatase n=1 Tax=Nocardia brasiliensis TaxID=37326 RepID=UPI00189438D0|nr:sirohydrochlorin chelatase [Nocardia brasiliensis]MBF6124019.1 sirohydrochlorin chelatase [Nocardia brasiliensis]